MTKLKIYLADLTHTGTRIATENIPLNIGLLASYAKMKFGNAIEFKLFKYPEKLLAALKNERCAVLACSSYIWNNNLAEWAFEAAKMNNPATLTVRGGWNFPIEEAQQLEYMKRHAFSDIYCIGEGEDAFSNIIERLLGQEKEAVWNKEPLSGSVFLKNDRLYKGPSIPRIINLDMIPSPYMSGLLDEFFDGQLTPIIETSRGCPFQCNYCNNSSPYYNKVNFFSPDYVIAEIQYIAKRASRKNIRNLYIADTNFGMYPRDKMIALSLRRMQKKYHWPLGIMTSTGKNNVKDIIENTEALGNSLVISMSVQSMNPPTLKVIKRDNIRLSMYSDISRETKKRGMAQMAELIVPLPKETYNSYVKGVEKLLEIGAHSVTSYTLQLNNGTVYKNEKFRRRYGYEGKFRLIPYDFGIYGGKKVFDYEEVSVNTKTLSFQDYLKIRKLALIMEILFSHSTFYEIFKILNENGINMFEFCLRLLNSLNRAPKAVKAVFASFARETTTELKASEEELVQFYNDGNNYEKLETGQIGGNVIYKHKALMMRESLTDWVDYIFDCCLMMLKENKAYHKTGEVRPQVENVKLYILAKLDKMFVPDQNPDPVRVILQYDIASWLKNRQEKPLAHFKAGKRPLQYRFFFSQDQLLERGDIFKRYGSDLLGLVKILAKVTTLDRLIRKVDAHA